MKYRNYTTWELYMKKLIFLLTCIFALFNQINCEELKVIIGGKPYVLAIENDWKSIEMMKQNRIVAKNFKPKNYLYIGLKGCIRLHKMSLTLCRGEKTEIANLYFNCKLAEDNYTLISIIDQIFVDKYFRKKGLGSFLIKYFCNELYLTHPDRQIKLTAHPLVSCDEEEHKKLTIELINNFYKLLGFTKKDDSENEMIYDHKKMIKITISDTLIQIQNTKETVKKEDENEIRKVSNLILEY